MAVTLAAQVMLMDGGISHLTYLFEIAKHLDYKVKQTLLICGGYGVTNLFGAIFLHASIMFSFVIASIEYVAGVLNAQTLKKIDNKSRGQSKINSN